jgi:hypothetical protein
VGADTTDEEERTVTSARTEPIKGLRILKLLP